MISKVTLMDLFKDTFRRSTLISIPDISELLVVPGSMFSKWEIFYTIVRDALEKFEFYFPLGLCQKIYIEVDSNTRKAYLNDNFKAYLNGIVPESAIVLLPSAVIGMSTSFYTASTYPLRDFRYNPPEFTDFWYSSNTYYVNCICKRPFIEEYEEVSKEPTDRCAVYYMNKYKDTEYSIFRDEVYLSTCRYIMNIRKNMMLQNMPIELFSGLEEDFNRLEPKQSQLYEQGANNAYWVM